MGFGQGKLIVEDGEVPDLTLYQKRIKVAFVEKIRNEEKFNSDQDLIVRMKKDCERIKEILTKTEVLDNN